MTPRFFALVILVALASIQPAAAFDRQHALLARVLSSHVRGGLVDYAALVADRKPLDGYVASLGSVSESEMTTWSRNERFAFWIDAYNALTLQVVADHYPIEGSWFSLYPRKSIRQISGVWDKLQFRAGGKTVTLEAIEHAILRKEFGDPRLHAAINCASVSCPELRAEPYAADKLDRQLDEAARAFASDPRRNRIEVGAKKIEASKIFEWFSADFLTAYGADGKFSGLSGGAGAAVAFLARFAPQEAAGAIRTGGFTVRFQSYDWTLNDLAK